MLDTLEPKTSFYQLITSPAILKNENKAYNTVYSILLVSLSGDAAETVLAYDVARTRAEGNKILSEVRKHAPQGNDILEFISELL